MKRDYDLPKAVGCMGKLRAFSIGIAWSRMVIQEGD